jgi:hypothetical protein
LDLVHGGGDSWVAGPPDFKGVIAGGHVIQVIHTILRGEGGIRPPHVGTLGGDGDCRSGIAVTVGSNTVQAATNGSSGGGVRDHDYEQTAKNQLTEY